MLGNNSTIKIGTVLALVAIVGLSAPVSAVSMSFLSLDSGTEFQNNVDTTSGTVSYTTDGVELVESSGGSSAYTTQTVNLTSDNGYDYQVNYDFTQVDAPATIWVYDASDGTLITDKEVTSSGSGTVSWTGAMDVYVEVEVPNDGDGTSGETTTLDSLELVAPNSSPQADFEDVDNTKTVSAGEEFTVDASPSNDPDGDSLTYDWDTDGDGNYDDASGSTVTDSRSSTGEYDYSVKVSDGYGGTDTGTVSVTVEEATGSLEVSGVTDSSGNSISSFDVTVADSSGSQVDSGTDVSAPYSVSGLTAGSTYDVTISASGYADTTKSITISENSTTSKSFSMSTLGGVDVTVEDPDGNALDSATVELVDADGNAVDSVMTDSSGNVSFSDLAAGDYTLNVKHTDYQPKNSVSVSVANGETTTETVQMDDYRTLEFTVEDSNGEAISGATVEVKQDGSVVSDATTGDDGTVNVGQIADGTYTIAVNGTDYKSAEKSVDLTADAQISADLVSSDSSESSSMTVEQDSTGGGGAGSVSSSNILIIIGAFASIFVVIGSFLAIKD